ncbi:MAG: DoxX family protein [Candidatus Altimarinota bacterium]
MKNCTNYQNLSIIFLRLILGAIFIWAGYAKWFIWSAPMEGMTPMMIYLTKFLSIVEPLGGIALVVGFLTQWAAGGLAIIMAGSLYFVYMMGASFFTGQTGTGADYNLLLLAGSAVLAAYGAGCWSIDALCCKKKK